MIEPILKEISRYLKDFDRDLVIKAYLFAKKAHEGQKRYSGEPYIIHPIEATRIMLTYTPDIYGICACLLHDVPENTNYTLTDIEREFGSQIARLVKGIVNLSKVYARDSDDQSNVWRRMVFAMAEDVRVILIKFVERLHNLRTLKWVLPEKQKRIAQESLEVFAPIAARLGMYRMKKDMEDICFSYLYPKEFENIKSQVEEHISICEDLLMKESEELHELLKRENLTAEVSSRLKHHYSIYQKMKRKNKNFIHELYDLVAFRIVLHDNEIDTGKFDDNHCYATLGLIHKHYTPLTKRFKDYIALPKENGYKSLHTAVMGFGKNHTQPTEIQIRTKRMHQEAEMGVAAHWEYKDGGMDLLFGQEKHEWLRSLDSLKNYIEEAKAETSEDMSIDILKDRIFVLTPRGDVRDLPKGSTPIDFAYAIHTDIGHRFRGAKANGNIVPLDYKLKNGEVLEILTGSKESPNLYWLSSVETPSAKSRIKTWFKNHDRDNLIGLGKDLLNKYLQRYNLPILDSNLKVLSVVYKKKKNMKEREDILEQIGRGFLNPKDVVNKMLEIKNINANSHSTKEGKMKKRNSLNKSVSSEILIKGESDIETKIARCCKPAIGDAIIGYITINKVVSIHKIDCNFIKDLEKQQQEKAIEASWASEEEDKTTIHMSIDFDAKVDLLKYILTIFKDYRIELKTLNTSHGKNISVLFLTILVDSFDKVHKAFDRIENLNGVKKVSQRDLPKEL